MIGGSVAAHAYSVVHGIAASLTWLAAFFVVGLALVPRRWHESLGRGESPVVLGSAIYVIGCWLGIARGLSLSRLAIGLLAVAVVLAVVRRRRLLDAFVGRVWPGAASWALAFAGFYLLAYLFTMPPVTADYLPVAWTGNIDLLTYARYTKYLERLGPSNLAGFSYLNFVYLQTPGVFYLLGSLSLFFGREPLYAAMPAQFAFSALIALTVARVSRAVFSVSRAGALAVGAVAISGPFFRYVAGAYFLSTLMATPVLLYLLWTTVACASSRRFDPRLAIRFTGAYLLLLFLYPFLLFAGIAAQVAAVAVGVVADLGAGTRGGWPWRDAGRHAIRTASAMMASLALLAAVFHDRVSWSIDMVRSLSQAGVAGWPLDVVSPLALFGVPVRRVDHFQCAGCAGIDLVDPAGRAWAIAGFGALAMALAVLYFWRGRNRTSPAARTLAALTAGAMLTYCAYYLQQGPSYQQWKFASYAVLPLSFVVLAGGWQLVHESAAFQRLARTRPGRRLAVAALVGVPVALVTGNLVVHAASDPPLLRLPGALRNIAQVDRLPFRDLSIWMSESSIMPTWVALYFLPSKRVHVISSTFRPSERLSFEQVSPEWPMLIQDYGCEGVGHADTMVVEDVGCLLLEPPSLTENVSYPFSRTYLFVDFQGLSLREVDGRWNAGSAARLTLTADPTRVGVGGPLYVNVRLSPFLPDGVRQQRLAISWGEGRQADVALTGTATVSLPIEPPDWDGNRIWTLPIAFAFPDAIAGRWVQGPDGPYREGRPLAVQFKDLSISEQPDGEPVTPAGQPASGNRGARPH